MFTRKLQPRSKLDEAIDDLLDRMLSGSFEPDKYAKMVDQLVKLYKLKEIETPRRVSPDTLAMIAGNIIGIVLILGHERANVITSKAIGFVLRLK
jgi:hypothetical protein